MSKVCVGARLERSVVSIRAALVGKIRFAIVKVSTNKREPRTIQTTHQFYERLHGFEVHTVDFHGISGGDATGFPSRVMISKYIRRFPPILVE